MENTKNIPISIDINDALSMYLHGSEIVKKPRESEKGIILENFIKN